MLPPSDAQGDHSNGRAILESLKPEQLFRAIFEQAAVGITLVEATTGRFLHVNQQFCNIVGLLPDQVRATTFMAITHPDDLQPDLRNMEALNASRIHHFSMEKRYIRPDGSIVWVDLTVAPLWEAGDQPNFHIAVVQDITARKQAKQNVSDLNATLEQQVVQRTYELEESRQRLQAIVDGTSDAVYIKDLEGRFLLFNHAAEQFVGKRQSEVLGRDDRFVLPPDEARAVMEGDRHVMAAGVTMTYEEIATTTDGAQRTFLSTKGPLFDGQGRVTGLFGISRDITERKRAEHALSESEERLRRIFEHAAIGIAFVDMNGRFLRCNPAYCALLGYSEEELCSLAFPTLVHPDDRAANMAEVERVTSQELPWFEIENRYRHKDGHDVWAHKFVSVLRNEAGQPTHLFALVTDITERRRMREVLEQRVAERTVEVRARETELVRLIGHFPGLVSRVDRDLRYRYVSPQYEEWFGKNASDLLGCTIAEVIGPAAFERAKPAIKQALSGESVTIENSIPTATGEIRHVLTTYEPEFNLEACACTGFAIFVVDITDQRRESAFLAAEKQTLELVANGTSLNEVLAFLCQTIEIHTAPMLCSVMLVTEDRAHLTSAAAPSLPDAYNRVVDGIPIGPTVGSCGSAAHFGKPSIVTEIATHPLWEGYAALALQHGLQACWSQPILSSSGTVLGTFAAYYREPRTPQPHDLKWVERASHLAQLAIEHARVAEALRASEAQFQTFMNHSPMVAFIKDRAGRYLYVNATYEQLFHVSLDQIRGKIDGDWLPKELAQRLRENDREVFTAGQPLQFEETVPTPDGVAQHWLVMKFPLRSVTGDLLLGGVAVDITPRRRAEQALRESEERYGLAVAGTTDGIWDWNIITGDLYLSPRWKALLGYFPHEVPNQREAFFGYLHPDDRDRVHAAVRAHLERREPYAIEFRLRRKDGLYGWFLSRGQAVWDVNGPPLRMVGAITDISERKQAEEKLRTSYRRLQELTRQVQAAEERERARLSRELHDEFGQVLSVLKLTLSPLVQCLRNGAPDRALVTNRVKSALDMIDQLFVSLRSMVAASRPAILEQLGLIPAIKSLAAETMSVSGVQCRVIVTQKGIPDSFPATMEGALYRIAQALLTNVVRHAHATRATIRFGCADGVAKLTVRDNGQGFSIQALQPTSRGLRGIRERAELLGGSVDIHSRPGRTSVTVSLPLEGPSFDDETTGVAPAWKQAIR